MSPSDPPAHDRTRRRGLSFTFPEIARPLRARVERQIGPILPEFLRPEERTALLAELESRWGFRQLDQAAQEPECPVGGCLPISDSSARMACAKSRFIFNPSIVARPVGVRPITRQPFH